MNLPAFANLWGAWFFLAAIPLVILYFLKLKRPRMTVPSLVLWQSVVNDQRVNSPFQKFKRNWLLFLQLLLLFLLVISLMQPFLGTGSATGNYHPILVDCSASMGAVDATSGKTRLDLVKEDLRERLADLPSGQQVALYAFAETGRRLTDFTNDRRELLKAVDALEVLPLEGKLDDVLRMAAANTRQREIETVTVITDGNLNDKVDFELAFELEFERVGELAGNLGITEMSARRSGANEWEVFVRIAGSMVELSTGKLELYRDDELLGEASVEAAVDESQRLVFPVTAEAAGLLEARLKPDGEDSLASDNQVWLSLPDPRPLRCWVADELNGWRFALQAGDSLEISSGAVAESGGDYDLTIADSPEQIEGDTGLRLLIGSIPEDVSDLIEVKESFCDVVDWKRTHPLLRHVSLGDVQIGQSPEWILAEGRLDKPEDAEATLEDRGYEVLVYGSRGPLVLQQRQGLKTSVWFLFHTDRSTLPYRVAFPILASNAVESALREASLSEVRAAPNGVLPPLQLQGDRSYRVVSPDGSETESTTGDTGLLAGIAAPMTGRYDVFDGSEKVVSVGTGLLSLQESMLTSVEAFQFAELKVEADSVPDLPVEKSFWWILSLLGFAVMLYEWWYFQRARGARA